MSINVTINWGFGSNTYVTLTKGMGIASIQVPLHPQGYSLMGVYYNISYKIYESDGSCAEGLFSTNGICIVDSSEFGSNITVYAVWNDNDYSDVDNPDYPNYGDDYEEYIIHTIIINWGFGTTSQIQLSKDNIDNSTISVPYHPQGYMFEGLYYNGEQIYDSQGMCVESSWWRNYVYTGAAGNGYVLTAEWYIPLDRNSYTFTIEWGHGLPDTYVTLTDGSTANNNIQVPTLPDYELYGISYWGSVVGNFYDSNGNYVVSAFWNEDGTFIAEHVDISNLVLHAEWNYVGSGTAFTIEWGHGLPDTYVTLTDGSTANNNIQVPTLPDYELYGIMYEDSVVGYFYDSNGNFVVGTYWNDDGTFIADMVNTSNLIAYAYWEENERLLKVNYYSNYANEAIDFSDGENRIKIDLNPNENQLVKIDYHDMTWRSPDGLRDYSGFSNKNTLIMRRSGYIPLRYWNTQPDGSGISIHEIPRYSGYPNGITGEELMAYFGVEFDENYIATVNLYPQWEKHTDVYFCLEDGVIFASDFIEDNSMFIDEVGRLHAPSFIKGNFISIGEDGISAKNFTYGVPEFPYAGSLFE